MAPRTTPQPYTRARNAYSSLQKERLAADHHAYFPAVLEGCPQIVKKQAIPADEKDAGTIKGLFPATYDTPLVEFAPGESGDQSKRPPVKVGVVLSGGQAPGGHNVIAGIYDGIKQWNPASTMIGFLDGPHGIFTGNFSEITDSIMDGFRNTGGFDMLGSGRHKIETEEQFKDSMTVCSTIGLDGLVVIGGDDSNTNGAVLAEYFKANGCKTKVVGAPKTIDGDLKCPPYIPVSFGFDTACKTYATLVSNVAVDALSAQKYYHIVRLMGRSASNIALEVALLTRPNACLLGEEVARDKKSLKDLTVEMADMIQERSKLGKDYGVIILPEGLIEFIPEFNTLMAELNDKLAEPGVEPTEEGILKVLSPSNAEVFKFLPDFIRAQLLLDRDPHGNVQVAKIETEKLLAATITQELQSRKAAGTYKGHFKTQFHAYGYEGRAGLPTIFDGSYCYALGATAAGLLCNGLTGLIASVKNLLAPAREWQCGGVPVTSLCVIERRKGKEKPVIKKALVEMEGPMSQPYTAYIKMRDTLRFTDAYNVTGPIQYDMETCESSKDIPITLQLELGKDMKPLPAIPEPMKMGKFLFIGQPLESRSELQQWRSSRKHQLPDSLKIDSLYQAEIKEISSTMCKESDFEYLKKLFSTMEAPLVQLQQAGWGTMTMRKTKSEVGLTTAGINADAQRIGVVFCGRQAPGCHDFLCGMVDMLSKSPSSKVLGIIGGTQGLFAKQVRELTPEICRAYAGTGGLELLGRTVDRLKTDEELENAKKACEDLGLTGLVLVGGARTNSDAAYVAEYFAKAGSRTAIIGVPCGIEGNMVNEFVEASIGFDSAAKAIAQLVGNTAIDGSSARKYYYFLRVMDGASTGGRTSTSHLALEVALQTKPNMLLLTEEVDEKRLSLRELVNSVANMIAARAERGSNFGTILVAEGLLSAIPEFRNLISELEAIPMPNPVDKVLAQLTQWSRALFQSLPDFIQHELLLERQSNAALQMSQLETERLLAALVEDELKQRKKDGTFKGSFSPVCQFIGYQARCSMPSDFDMDYAYTLGATSTILAAGGRNGYMALVTDLSSPVANWRAGGVPFTAMLSVPGSDNSGFRPRPVIFPHRVDLDGGAFKTWLEERSRCANEEMYENPGPIQLSGPSASGVSKTITMKFSYLQELEELRNHFADVVSRCRPGCDLRTVRVAKQSLATLNLIMDELAGGESAVEQREGFSSRGRLGTMLV
eukprot:CAMPEP_0206446278 /NCGR_PEP_ID=MMETSP0324_2-20121206/16038_1 /ASSEMBLY_ACC=CAM_ASM_000836 /TAXON_ID=2866 /ORGANISM="Crypthecodinium cohnii, Strain Seligo" /LENGTH=1222 /DNA_ID=CAMNT_0053914713 /DNA_START=149 /DNA_END=3817 /DNA_ORIENTATION=-